MRGKNPKERINNAIQKSSELADSFTDRLQQSWRAVAAGAALVLSVSFFLLWVAFTNPFAKSAEMPEIVIQTPTSTDRGLARALDGVYVDTATSTNLLPFAVMVENSSDAWPLLGPAKANLVYEAPVEGSITRLMLFFDPMNEVDLIGPVRSARPYYVHWANGLDALYTHVGGSPASLSGISQIEGFRDLDEFANARYFWRSASRSAPHNVFTKTEFLINAMEDKEYEAGDFNSWSYEDPKPAASPADGGASSQQPDEDGENEQNVQEVEEVIEEVDVPRINIPYQGVYEAHWEYDANTGLYTRYQNGVIQKDADGEVVRAKNVVVIRSYATVLDRIGRLNLRTTGRGKAYVFHDGRKYDGEWKRTGGEHIRFEAIDGRDIPFARGTTWISVLITNNSFYNVIPRD